MVVILYGGVAFPRKAAYRRYADLPDYRGRWRWLAMDYKADPKASLRRSTVLRNATKTSAGVIRVALPDADHHDVHTVGTMTKEARKSVGKDGTWRILCMRPRTPRFL